MWILTVIHTEQDDCDIQRMTVLTETVDLFHQLFGSHLTRNCFHGGNLSQSHTAVLASSDCQEQCTISLVHTYVCVYVTHCIHVGFCLHISYPAHVGKQEGKVFTSSPDVSCPS